MDRSVDSIGSCSLDVDADSLDISDTSGSLNFPTPISIKDITREFTANIRERCSVRTLQNTAAIVDPVTGQVRLVLTQPASSDSDSSALPTIVADVCADKKPSYLNLACCVNGYSNLTTYDSKIRQDINKSREVSPIRPSSSSIQYCKKSNSLAPPILLKMPNISVTKQPSPVGKNYTNAHEANNNDHNNSNNGHFENGNNGFEEGTMLDERRNTSFIQQRVERLYGPGALAQGFYSPKKKRSPVAHAVDADSETSELAQKFQQLSPSKDYSQFRKKLDAAEPSSLRPTYELFKERSPNNSIDLPVLRHLSQEFRAQLPTISPKRNFSRNSPEKDNEAKVPNDKTLSPHAEHETTKCKVVADEVDHQIPVPSATVSGVSKTVQVMPESNNANKTGGEHLMQHDLDANAKQQQPAEKSKQLKSLDIGPTAAVEVEKDGNYFLALLKVEQARLLALANDAEKYIDALTNNPEINEDTLGFLRSAAGKARLLVSQKMKQFEGLCHNNLNRSPEDKFPTTVDDLQGFWDMVYLQVDHIDAIFAEIETLKINNWQMPKTIASAPANNNNATKSPQKFMKTVNSAPRGTRSMTSMTGAGAASATASSCAENGVKAVKSAAALKRESQRKQLLEMKRKHKIALTANPASGTDEGALTDAGETQATNSAATPVEIFVSERNS